MDNSTRDYLESLPDRIRVTCGSFDYYFSNATIERAARALAQAVNGGDWETDYTDPQRDLWRRRVIAALQTP